MQEVLKYVLYCMVTLTISFYPAPLIPTDMPQHDAYEVYYKAETRPVYGYATRYGPDHIAINELLWSAREYAAQRAHGFALIGGGYGYHVIDGTEYLAQNRASPAYGLLAALPQAAEKPNQARLASLAAMPHDKAYEFVQNHYAGVVSLRSPNNIGREFCLMTAPDLKPIGLVIVGGTAARNDYLPYGPSLNDYYGHLRMGQRVLELDGRQYYWVADLSDGVYYDAGGTGGGLPVALGWSFLCGPVCTSNK